MGQDAWLSSIGFWMTLSGFLGIWLSIAALRNPAFYERTLRYGSPPGTPIRPFAIMGIVVGCCGFLFGIAILLGALSA